MSLIRARTTVISDKDGEAGGHCSFLLRFFQLGLLWASKHPDSDACAASSTPTLVVAALIAERSLTSEVEEIRRGRDQKLKRQHAELLGRLARHF